MECWLGVPARGQGARRPQLPARARGARVHGRATPSSTLLIADDERRDGRASARRALLEDYEALVGRAAARGPRDRRPGRARRDLLHGRDDRHAQGRDAQPPQPARQRAAQPRRHRPRARPDRWLHVCPMFHVAGTSNVFACTWVGAAQVVLPRFEAARRAGDDRARADHPHRARADDARDAARRAAPTAPTSAALRHLQYAASPISPELQRRVLEWLPDCDVVQFYGMTEAAPTVTHLTRRDHRERPDRLASMGAPVPGVQVRGARRRSPRRGRRAVGPRSEHHARLLEPAGGDRATRSSTAGTAPATSPAPTRTATSTWSTAPRT